MLDDGFAVSAEGHDGKQTELLIAYGEKLTLEEPKRSLASMRDMFIGEDSLSLLTTEITCVYEVTGEK